MEDQMDSKSTDTKIAVPLVEKKEDLKLLLSSKRSDFSGHWAKSKRSKFNNLAGVIVILSLTLLVLGGFAFFEIQQNQRLINNLRTEITIGQVAGVNTQNPFVEEPVTGLNFSILTALEKPSGFNLETTESNSTVFENRSSGTSSFLVKDSDKKSGIEIESTEYDNKYNLSEFVEVYFEAKALNSNKSELPTVILPGDVMLLRVFQDEAVKTTFYLGVTTQNYYLISIYNQIEDPKVQVYTENLLENLYLN